MQSSIGMPSREVRIFSADAGFTKSNNASPWSRQSKHSNNVHTGCCLCITGISCTEIRCWKNPLMSNQEIIGKHMTICTEHTLFCIRQSPICLVISMIRKYPQPPIAWKVFLSISKKNYYSIAACGWKQKETSLNGTYTLRTGRLLEFF